MRPGGNGNDARTTTRTRTAPRISNTRTRANLGTIVNAADHAFVREGPKIWAAPSRYSYLAHRGSHDVINRTAPHATMIFSPRVGRSMSMVAPVDRVRTGDDPNLRR